MVMAEEVFPKPIVERLGMAFETALAPRHPQVLTMRDDPFDGQTFWREVFMARPARFVPDFAPGGLSQLVPIHSGGVRLAEEVDENILAPIPRLDVQLRNQSVGNMAV